MFDIRGQKERIANLKTRLGVQREEAARQLRIIVPRARRVAVAGSLAWSARKALPLLQPVAFGLARRALGSFSAKRVAAAIGLAGVAAGVWRLLRNNDRN